MTGVSILADPLFGDLSIRAKPFIVEGSVSGSALLGDLAIHARQVAAQVRTDAFFGEILATARVYPPPAAELPEGVTRYYCKLTGTTDLILPLSSFSARHRVGSASYYSIVIPSFSYVSEIAARPLGQIVIWSDTDGAEEELSRGTLGDVRTDRGARSQSITISGNSSQAATPRATYQITDVLYAYSTFDGEQRLRIRPRAAIRPGDTVRYGSTFFEVGLVSWSVSASEASMEIATVAPSGDADPPPLTLPYSATLEIESGEWERFAFDLAAGSYRASLSGIDEVDLYTRVGAAPTESTYGCKPFSNDNPKLCDVTLESPETWHIGLRSYLFGAVTLSVSELTGGWPCGGEIFPPWSAIGDGATIDGGELVFTAGPGQVVGMESPEFVSAGSVTVDVSLAGSGSGAMMAIGENGADGVFDSQEFTEMTFEIGAGEKFAVVAIGNGGTAVVRIRAGSGSEHFSCA